MKIFVCIDKSGGMLFNNRRLSQDSIVRQKMLEITGSSKLYLNSYSAKQFESSDKLIIDDNFLTTAAENDFCFIENLPVPDNADEYYIFNWNRDYPADTYFSLDPKAPGFKKVKSENFTGSSHKKITLEIYSKI